MRKERSFFILACKFSGMPRREERKNCRDRYQSDPQDAGRCAREHQEEVPGRKLPLVDEVIELDRKNRGAQQQADSLRSSAKCSPSRSAALMGQGKKDEAEEVKAAGQRSCPTSLPQLEQLEEKDARGRDQEEHDGRSRRSSTRSVPIGKDDSENVEVRAASASRSFRISRSRTTSEIMEKLQRHRSGRRTPRRRQRLLLSDGRHRAPALCRDLSYARDFMIDRGFTYVHPAVYDPQRRGHGRYELCRDGDHDVQDRGRGPLPRSARASIP